MMKHMLAFAWGWVIVLSTTMVFGAQPLAPAAVFSQPSFQFESALEGQAVEHDFLVQNKGSADLRIEKIKTG
jgi:hypothetical protein